jgi:hypothetical protein
MTNDELRKLAAQATSILLLSTPEGIVGTQVGIELEEGQADLLEQEFPTKTSTLCAD